MENTEMKEFYSKDNIKVLFFNYIYERGIVSNSVYEEFYDMMKDLE